MKLTIAVLILLACLQASVLPLDLVLLILVLRTYVNRGKENLYLAFGFGLLLSHLTFAPLGILSIIYLAAVIFTDILSRSRESNHLLTVIPLTLIVLSINSAVNSLLLHQSINIWPKVFLERIAALPIYILIKFWDERFVVK